MNENHKQISKNILMNSVTQESVKNAKKTVSQYNIVQDGSYFDYELLKAALVRRRIAIVNFILKLRCRVRNPSKINAEETPLHLAMSLGNSAIINKILKNGASIYDKNMKEETAIYRGFKDGYYHAVNTALKYVYLNKAGFKNIDPLNKDDIIHFNIACVLNNSSVVEKYLNFRFNVNQPFTLDYPDFFGVYPLYYAAKKNDSNLFQLFLKHGADLSIKYTNGHTLLHILFYHSRFSMISHAFNYGNKSKFINSIDINGVSHFHISCTINNPDAVQVFIDKGVDVNSAISLTSSIRPGYTPLHFAAMHNNHAVVELLLKNGADCNKTDAKGNTPLHLACEKAISGKIIQTLLDYGASSAAAGQKGCTKLRALIQSAESDYVSSSSAVVLNLPEQSSTDLQSSKKLKTEP